MMFKTRFKQWLFLLATMLLLAGAPIGGDQSTAGDCETGGSCSTTGQQWSVDPPAYL